MRFRYKLLLMLGAIAFGIWRAEADSRTMVVGSTTNVSTSANQACNTTCSTGCLLGFNTGTLGVALPHIVACNDATADECVCVTSS